MINLVFLGLSITTLFYNNYNQTSLLTSTTNGYHYSDGDLLIYEHDGSPSVNTFVINTNNGSFQFGLEYYYDVIENGTYDDYSFKFSVLNEVYYTNIYVTNLKINIRDTWYQFKPVYFLGSSNGYYEDNESGNYNVQLPHANLGYQQVYGIQFDLELLPYRLVDGSEYSNGYNTGYAEGIDEGIELGDNSGYQDGYAAAKAEYENQDSVVNSIFSGILSIGLIPVEFLMSIFNFEVLGINFAHIISAILTIMVMVILLRIILGGKNGDK